MESQVKFDPAGKTYRGKLLKASANSNHIGAGAKPYITGATRVPTTLCAIHPTPPKAQ